MEKFNTFFDICREYNINTKALRLVRHCDKHIDIIDSFRNERDKFEAYQAFQAPDKFKGAEWLAVFGPKTGTTAMFLGIWEIMDYVANKDLTKEQHFEIIKYKFPDKWHFSLSWYSLEYNPVMKEHCEKLTVEWTSPRAWVQRKDKIVIEI